jgi:4-hydroxythreonine-4-phosphate dehydrogenase
VLLALTQGDPAGIGPELALMAWLEHDARGCPPFALLGSPDPLARLARNLGLDVPVLPCGWDDAEASFTAGLPVIPLEHGFDATPGKPDPASAAGTIESITRAVAGSRPIR